MERENKIRWHGLVPTKEKNERKLLLRRSTQLLHLSFDSNNKVYYLLNAPLSSYINKVIYSLVHKALYIPVLQLDNNIFQTWANPGGLLLVNSFRYPTTVIVVFLFQLYK